MNLTSHQYAVSKFLFGIAMKFRRLLPKRKSQAFGTWNNAKQPKIERIYVINLDRQPERWAEMEKELKHILDWSGNELWKITDRYAAIDAKNFVQEITKDSDIDPIYSLGEQLFVEPQPLVFPAQTGLNSPIIMSRPEIAVAKSHINIWQQIAKGNYEYVLILEDDVWFNLGFARHVDQVWSEIEAKGNENPTFDILYLSYEEVKHGAPKTFVSTNVFRPDRGLWHLSGYVLSREGAEKLLRLLPCRGPIDLWINHQFKDLNVRAIRRPIISQRRDIISTNSYSILPALTKIGALTSESASLFHTRPSEQPVFVFGSENSGLSSLAMALSMLGYRCCSDLQTIPYSELKMLLAGSDSRVFNAYVNVKSLAMYARTLKEHYPYAKFIITASKAKISDDNNSKIIDDLDGADIIILYLEAFNKWQIVCEHLRCAPPTCSFPELVDIGQRPLLQRTTEENATLNCIIPKRDKSPWIVDRHHYWQGLHTAPVERALTTVGDKVKISDNLESLNPHYWLPRDDTFTDNLALFRPLNLEFHSGIGATLSVKKENLGVRKFSAASLTSRDWYLFGRFETEIKVSNVPGVVTGFFLHRDSPRQEIDIEITGNRPDRLLVNVFYNPGGEVANFDYGYRGAPSYIDLGFDASESYHRFAIEWDPCEIRWFVDDCLVHRRVEWDPTPIPHLPMTLHINTWPSRSKELAGRITSGQLPTTTFIRSIVVEANRHRNSLL